VSVSDEYQGHWYEANQIAARASRLGADERRVLLLVLDGLEAGRKVYGELKIDEDGRDFMEESLAERRDAIIYDTIEHIRAMRRRAGK